MSLPQRTGILDGRNLPVAWIGLASALLGLAAFVISKREAFDWALALVEIPARSLAFGLAGGGLRFLAVLPLVRATAIADADLQRRLIVLVVGVGILLRLMMLPTEPMLEDDQQRYLWEGGLVAHGISPYRVSPNDAKQADRASALGQLAEAAGPVLDRVNHPQLKTIYPPVAMATFALAHWMAPFNLTAWRLLLFAAECGTLALMLTLLRDSGRPLIWSVLYWWNPIAIKEIANSGHMEGVLLPLLLAALLLTARRRPVAAMAALGFAVGVKVWPVLLAPLLLRPWLGRARTLATAGLVLMVLCFAWAVPIWLGGLDSRSGFVAYAGDWQANSALLPTLRDMVMKPMLTALSLPDAYAGQLARALLAAVAAVAAIVLAWRSPRDTFDLMQRAAAITLVLVLVSPAQFPWYMLWTLPLLPFAPRFGVAAMAVTLPLYYLSFYFSAHGAYGVFRDQVVWLIWVPIWILLALEPRAPREQATRVAPSSD